MSIWVIVFCYLALLEDRLDFILGGLEHKEIRVVFDGLVVANQSVQLAALVGRKAAAAFLIFMVRGEDHDLG